MSMQKADVKDVTIRPEGSTAPYSTSSAWNADLRKEGDAEKIFPRRWVSKE